LARRVEDRQAGVGLFLERAGRVLGQEGLERSGAPRNALADVAGRPAELEFGELGRRDEAFVGINPAQPAVGVEGDDLFIEGNGLRVFAPVVGLSGQLGQDDDVLRVGRLGGGQGPERPLAPGDADDFLVELVRRGLVPPDPVDLLPLAVEEEEERRPGDGVLPVDGFARPVVPLDPEEDESFGQKGGVVRVFVVLLTQQEAAPSAARGEEVEEEELVLGLGFGQGVVERPLEPGDLGRKDRGREKQEEKEGDDSHFFHPNLLEAETPSLGLG
jgi:hypothetical protein